jgi:hypothetical protein
MPVVVGSIPAVGSPAALPAASRSSAIGSASASQAEGCEFEPRLLLPAGLVARSILHAAVAQSGERIPGTNEARGSTPRRGSGFILFSPIAQWWSVRLLSGGFQVRVLVGEPRGSSLRVKRLSTRQDRAEFESRLPLLFSVRNDGRVVMQRFAKPSSGIHGPRRFDSSSFRIVTSSPQRYRDHRVAVLSVSPW